MSDPTPEALEIVWRIKTRLTWLRWTQADLAHHLGCSKATIATHMTLRPKTADPLAWGRNGGRVSLDTIAEVTACPRDAFLPDYPPEPLVGPPPAE